MGIARVQEALESNDWAQLDADDAALSDFGDFEDPGAKSDEKEDEEDEEQEEDKDLDLENLDFGFDRADFEGLRKAIWSGGGDGRDPDPETDKERMKLPSTAGAENAQSKDTSTSQPSPAKIGEPAAKPMEDPAFDDGEIAKVETMMRKLQAVREAGEGMGEEQRRRMAARAVEEVMREL
jgi:hypothetical protein